jgi:hypothetical protein
MKYLIAIVLAAALIACLALNMVQWLQVQKMKATISSQATQLDQAKSTINMLQGELQSIKPDVQKTRTIPVEIKIRKAFTGDSLVLIFRNTNDKALKLNVRCTTAAYTTSKQFKIDVVPGRLMEIGSLQGWPAASGDKLEITCDGYDNSTFTIP